MMRKDRQGQAKFVASLFGSPHGGRRAKNFRACDSYAQLIAAKIFFAALPRTAALQKIFWLQFSL
jgi:hypothetical protein